MPSKPLLCRIGFHRKLYIDSAGFVSGERCGLCHDWMDPHDREDVESFRAFVAAATPEEKSKGMAALYFDWCEAKVMRG